MYRYAFLANAHYIMFILKNNGILTYFIINFVLKSEDMKRGQSVRIRMPADPQKAFLPPFMVE